MTPSKQARLNSLAETSEISNVPTRTWQDWVDNYPKRFEFSCIGSALIKDGSEK